MGKAVISDLTCCQTYVCKAPESGRGASRAQSEVFSRRHNFQPWRNNNAFDLLSVNDGRPPLISATAKTPRTPPQRPRCFYANSGFCSVPDRQIGQHGNGENLSFGQRRECLHTSRSSLRFGQFGPIEAEFLTDSAHVVWIQVLVRTTKRRLRRPPFSMHRDHDETLSALLLRKVEATPSLR